MKKTLRRTQWLIQMSLLTVALNWASSNHAAQLLNFQFNEGSGTNIADSASGLVGTFGTQQDPSLDYVELSTSSPSGQPGDGSIAMFGGGFLVAQDTNQVLNITSGPITLEAWVYLPPVSSNLAGIVSYGNSYKMGLRGGYQVFTLYGLKDITNSAAGFIFDSQWNHLVAAWEPGLGVHFYVNGVHNFVEYTNSAVARPVAHDYLVLGAENFGNNFPGSLDRVRIHHALLDETQIDSDPANPKVTLANTIVSYNFDEASFPCTNAIAPSMPTIPSLEFFPSTSAPSWTNDTPTGLPNDFALAFDYDNAFREVATVKFGSTPIDLAANNTNYTLQAWIKMPTTGLEERRVIYVSGGPAPRIALSINANRTLHTTIFGVADFTTSVTVPNDNRWHHVAAVMENYARIHFYLDGVLRQTVNRTQTGTATSDAGGGNLRIGKESETRYFYGLLDRVIINNDALTNSTLDFPATPGLATFATLAAHPASVAIPAGSNATFTASPSSPTPATYQWYYRTTLAGQGTPIAGETSTNLTVTNVGSANLGYYSLVVSNAAGIIESYAARLSFPVDMAPRPIGFEAPSYASGAIDEQDAWISVSNADASCVQTASEIADYLASIGNSTNEPVRSGSQALLYSGPGVAVDAFRTFTGLQTETNVTLDVWVRALDGTPSGNAFVTMENSSGTRAAAFRIGPAFSIDYGTSTTGVWRATGMVADPANWYHIKMALNYSTRTYDFFVNDVQVNSSPIPFYTATANRFDRVHLFKGANQIGMILDDLNVQGPPTSPQLGIRQSGDNLVLFWPSSVTDYVLEGTPSLTSPISWSPVSHTTVGDENQATIQPGTGNQFYRLKK